MRVFILFLVVFLSLISPVTALEYRGKNLDGRKLNARAFYGGTGGVYDVTVVFNGARATIYFNDGSETNIWLKSATVEDASNIIGYGRLGFIHLNRAISIGLESIDRNDPLTPTVAIGGDLWRLSIEPNQLE